MISTLHLFNTSLSAFVLFSILSGVTLYWFHNDMYIFVYHLGRYFKKNLNLVDTIF